VYSSHFGEDKGIIIVITPMKASDWVKSPNSRNLGSVCTFRTVPLCRLGTGFRQGGLKFRLKFIWVYCFQLLMKLLKRLSFPLLFASHIQAPAFFEQSIFSLIIILFCKIVWLSARQEEI